MTDVPTAISLPLEGEKYTVLVATLKEWGYVWGQDFWLGPSFRSQLLSGQAQIMFASERLAFKARMKWMAH